MLVIIFAYIIHTIMAKSTIQHIKGSKLSRLAEDRRPGPNLTKMGTSPRPHHVPTLRPHGPIS